MTAWAWLLACVIPSAMAAGPDRVLTREIQAIAQEEAKVVLFGKGKSPHYSHPRLSQPAGTFVTITKDGHTRGCWGNVHPQSATLAEEIITNTRKALVADYRFAPVNPSEYPELKFYVSLVGRLEPLGNPEQLHPWQEGLLVTNGRRGGVLLPGEAKTSRWAIAECCRKAGIKSRGALMYRFRTTVYGPKEEL